MPNQLTKKLGPLPTWAWAGIGILFVGMVFYFRRGSGDDVSAVSYDDSLAPQSSDSLPGSGTQYVGSSDGSIYGSGTYTDGAFTGEGQGSPVGLPPDFWATLAAGLAPNLSPGPTMYDNPTAPYQTQPSPSPSQGTQVVQTQTAKPVATTKTFTLKNGSVLTWNSQTKIVTQKPPGKTAFRAASGISDFKAYLKKIGYPNANV